MDEIPTKFNVPFLDVFSKVYREHIPALKKVLLFSGSAGLAQLIMMIYTLIVARWLGPVEYAVFAAAYSICTLTAFIFNWGFDTWILREGGDGNQTSRLISSVLELKGAIGLSWLAVLVAVIPVVRPDMFFPSLLLIAGLDVLGDSLFNTGLSTLNLQRRISGMSALLLISRGGRLISALAFVFANQHLAMSFVIGRAIATWIGLMISFIMIYKQIQWTRFQPINLWKRSSSFGLSEFLAMVYAQVDVTLLALLVDKASTGNYAPAVSLLNGLFILPNAIYNLLIPVLSRELPEKWKQAQKKFFLAIIGLTALGLVLWVGLYWGGEWVVSLLLGEAYQFSGQLIRILSPIIFIKSIEFGLAALLIAVGWQKKRLIPQFLSAVLIIGLDVMVIPHYGPIGAAVVYVICELVLLAGYLLLVLSWWYSSNNRRDGR